MDLTTSEYLEDEELMSFKELAQWYQCSPKELRRALQAMHVKEYVVEQIEFNRARKRGQI